MSLLIGATLDKNEIGYWKPKIPTNHIMRVFPNNLGDYRLPPTNWSTDPRYVYCEDEDVIPFVSSKIYKPTSSQYDGIAALALLKTYFQNLPSWVTKIYYTNIHEPEGDKFPGTQTEITPTEYKTWYGQIVTMLGTLSPAIRAKIHVGPALTRQYTENKAGRSYSDWDPGPTSGLASGLTEFFGVDFYGNSWAAGNANTAVTAFVAPATILKTVKAYKKNDTDTRPRYFPEIGYIGAPFDTGGQARAQWMAGIVAEVGTWNSDNPNWTMPWEFEGLIFWNTAGKPSITSVAGIGKNRWFQFDRRHDGSSLGSDPIGGYTPINNSPITARFNEMVAAQSAPDPDPPLEPDDPSPDEPDVEPDPEDATTGFVATPQPGNNPPRVLLEVEYTGQSLATVFRLDPDGSTRTVRLADPAALASGVWVGYDYETPFGVPVTYSAQTGAGTVTADPVTLNVTRAWLRHPGIPSLSIPIDYQGDGVPVRAADRAVLQPIGRRDPVVVSDGRRKSKTGTMTLRTATLAEMDDLLAILDDVSVLLLDIPPSLGYGVSHEYRSFGDLPEARFRPDYYPDQQRVWDIPFVVVGQPPGGQQSLRTWVIVQGESATWSQVIATYDTWADVLTGAL